MTETKDWTFEQPLEGGVQTSPEEERAKMVALFGKSDEE